VDLAEFDALIEPLRHQSVVSMAQHGFPLIDGHTATADEVADVEQGLGVILPAKYKSFMMRHGGGMFGFVDIFPVVSHSPNGDDLTSVNKREFPGRDFVAIAPVGTGDHWGFPVIDGRCRDEVWFHFHDAGNPELDAGDFLEFVVRHGLKP
jgi:hypothetical protein